MKKNFIIISVLVAFTLFGCKDENYDSGDGKYSYIKADFVEAHTISAKEINYVKTDDGDSLVLSPHVSADWAAKSDDSDFCSFRDPRSCCRGYFCAFGRAHCPK